MCNCKTTEHPHDTLSNAYQKLKLLYNLLDYSSKNTHLDHDSFMGMAAIIADSADSVKVAMDLYGDFNPLINPV